MLPRNQVSGPRQPNPSHLPEVSSESLGPLFRGRSGDHAGLKGECVARSQRLRRDEATDIYA